MEHSVARVPGLPSWLQPGSRLRRFAHWLYPFALGCGVTLFSFVSPLRPPIFLFDGLDTDAPWALVALAMLAAGVSAAWVRRARWPLFVVSLVTWLGMTMMAAVFVASYYAGAGRPGRPHRPGRAWPYFLAASTLVGVPVGWSAVHSDLLYEGMTGGLLFGAVLTGSFWVGMTVVLPFVFGLWVRARRQVLEQLRDRAERLEREQHERAERARSEERRRIAREMHDVVAHRVALMVLHAGALEVSTADPRTAEEAALIRTTGREAMQELREVLGMLRAPDLSDGTAPDLAPQPTLADLDRLLDASRAAGLPVRRVDVGQRQEVSLSAQRTAYRVVQEALTNVAKHAGAVPTTVTLRHEPYGLVVAVENAPPPQPAPPMPESGLGLVGLTERVGLAGGTVQARPRLDGGFLLHARIPADPPEQLATREVAA
ncbi:sensor histidine kinase [Catellatospora coxensis]|uniref:histidine kinase n=1 Tax=Catellatospora coxensis TaxID=310354 RepID=A0A8J3PC85_9ACTN|nr:histidine kinase [Catellatospora coxensis]GIG09686.1 two-component sensor histidine kinase [Catellatospora coxensis]